MQRVYTKAVQPVVDLALHVRRLATGGQPAPAAPDSAPQAEAASAFADLTLEQKAALWLQNRGGFKNSDRRQQIEEGEYRDPFAQARDVLQRAWVELVLSEVLGQLAKVRFVFHCFLALDPLCADMGNCISCEPSCGF